MGEGVFPLGRGGCREAPPISAMQQTSLLSSAGRAPFKVAPVRSSIAASSVKASRWPGKTPRVRRAVHLSGRMATVRFLGHSTPTPSSSNPLCSSICSSFEKELNKVKPKGRLFPRHTLFVFFIPLPLPPASTLRSDARREQARSSSFYAHVRLTRAPS